MFVDSLIEYHYRSFFWPKLLNELKIGGIHRQALAKICNFGIKNGIIWRNSNLNKSSISKSSEVIISLTSFPKRINSIWITIESLLNQSVKPKKIILWLSREQFPNFNLLPKKLIDQQNRGLTIEIVDGDLKSHKKYFYAFNKYPNNPILLVDDDIIYHSKMVETLIENFDENKVHFSYGYKIARDTDNSIKSYSDWYFQKDICDDDDLFFGSGGGTLIYPSSLPSECLQERLFMDLCPKADDIWLNAMVRLANLKIIKVRNEGCFPVLIKNNENLTRTNVGLNQNDIQINKVNQYYKNKLGFYIF